MVFEPAANAQMEQSKKTLSDKISDLEIWISPLRSFQL